MSRALLVAALVGRAAACDTTALDACLKAAEGAIGLACGTPECKLAVCNALTAYDLCYIAQTQAAPVCTEAQIMQYNKGQVMRTSVATGTFGIDCLKDQGVTPAPLSSGDSGSGNSGSQTKASSGSKSGMYPWQTAILVIFIICCICIVAGGVGALLFGKKPKGGKKGMRRPEPAPAPEGRPVVEEEVPIVSMAVDMNNDGITDAIVTGEDRNRDGIPDILEDLPLAAGDRIISISGDMAPPGTKGLCKARSQYGNQAGEYYEYLWDTGATSWSDVTVWKQYVQKDTQAVMEVVQNPMNPLVGTQGLLETAQGEVTVINDGAVEPLLFGPVQPLLAAPTMVTGAYPTTASNYMTYGGLAPTTTSYAVPQTTSYSTGVGAYGAYGTPTYATTNYAGGVI